MNIENIREELRNSTIENICIKYELSFKELCKLLSSPKVVVRKKREDLPDYIYSAGNRYEIRRTVNNESVYYGAFHSLDEAVRTRDNLIAKNWEATPEEYLGDKYIYLRKNRYVVQKTRNRVTRQYGHYKTSEDARKVRNELVKVDWNYSKLKEIQERLGVRRKKK